MVQNAAYLAEAVDVPLIADADTGYGNAINMSRTMRRYERAGIAGAHIEDQVAPKKCNSSAAWWVRPALASIKARAGLSEPRLSGNSP